METTFPSTTVPVVSLCMFDSSKRERLLLGVRLASAVSARHPNVLSTPTMRIPEEMLPTLLGPDLEKASQLALGERFDVNDAPHCRLGAPNSTSKMTSLISEAILSRKMGLGDDLVAGRLTGEAWVASVAFDRVIDESPEDSEDTLMVTIVVECDQVPDLEATGSYSSFAWVPADRLSEAVEKKDPFLLIDRGYPWEVCLHGLCVRAAASIQAERS